MIFKREILDFNGFIQSMNYHGIVFLIVYNKRIH